MKPEDELARLEDSDEWDWEHPEVHEPSPRPEAVVPVRFAPGELAQVETAADRTGRKLTDYVREAALTAARKHEAAAGG